MIRVNCSSLPISLEMQFSSGIARFILWDRGQTHNFRNWKITQNHLHSRFSSLSMPSILNFPTRSPNFIRIFSNFRPRTSLPTIPHMPRLRRTCLTTLDTASTMTRDSSYQNGFAYARVKPSIPNTIRTREPKRCTNFWLPSWQIISFWTNAQWQEKTTMLVHFSASRSQMQNFHGTRLNSTGEIEFHFRDYFLCKSLSYFVIFFKTKVLP